jgi:hypothetical protein
METFDTKFASFLKFLENDGDMELNDELIDLFREALTSAKFDQVGGNVLARKKRLNGYNLFMRERMGVLKETVSDSNTRMSKISEEWNGLDEQIKEDWREKAKKASIGPIKIKVKAKKPNKPPKLSGYQVFVSEKMDTLKDIKPKERMTEIGKLWSEQPVEKKEEYKQKANERNAEAVIKFNEAKVKEAENVEAKTEVAE